MNLVIVESPIKSKTISEILLSLGLKDFFVIGTAGHIKNLPVNNLAVEYKNNKYIGHYEIIKTKVAIINNIKKKIKEAEKIFICTDDDREGERIAEDILEVCKIKEYNRIIFREITKEALAKAFIHNKGIKKINKNIVLAQNTRRLIDRVIGYRLKEPIEYYFQKNNLTTTPHSIGSVEALGLKIIAEREEAIEKYHEEGEKLSHVIVAEYKYNGIPFNCNGKGLIFDEDNVKDLEETLSQIRPLTHIVSNIDRKNRKASPPKRLVTSYIYAKCSYLFNVTPTEIENSCKKLFYLELINYPRTDSYEISNEAVSNIILYLESILDEEHKEYILYKKRKIQKPKENFAQEAHECVRPLNINKKYSPLFINELINGNPDKYKGINELDLKIYKFIFEVTIASQLSDSIYDATKITIIAGEFIFEQNANFRTYLGWECLELESLKDRDDLLQVYNQRTVVIPQDICIDERFSPNINTYIKKTHAPKRISEYSLIKNLNKEGVARPSTLTSVSKKLIDKKYISSSNNIFSICELGSDINMMIKNNNISWLYDFKKKKELEKTIKLIEEGTYTDTNGLISEYWNLIEDFKKDIKFNSKEKLINSSCPSCNQNIIEENNLFSCDNCDFKSFKKANFAYLKKISKDVKNIEDSNKIVREILINNKYVVDNFKCLIFHKNIQTKKYGFKSVKCENKKNNNNSGGGNKIIHNYKNFKVDLENIFKNKEHSSINNKIAVLVIKTKDDTNITIFDKLVNFTNNFENKRIYSVASDVIYITIYGKNILYAKKILNEFKNNQNLLFLPFMIKENENLEDLYNKIKENIEKTKKDNILKEKILSTSSFKL